ncbi:MAG: ribonuclease R [Clostridiales bacterium]|nr:ribonuclease R [Clostridiales bacterium]
MTDELLLKDRKERLLAVISDPAYRPMKRKELSVLLSVPQEKRDEFQEVLDALVAEGRISLSKRGKYGKPESLVYTGTFIGNEKGFGFVTVDGMEGNVHIAAEHTKGAMHGDQVEIVVQSGSHGKRTEGRVTKVLVRANPTLVGYYQKHKNFGFVVPDHPRIGTDIFIPQGKDMGAVTGHKVVATITDYGQEHRAPEGMITEIIGHVNDPGTDILSIVRAYGIPDEYPPEVMEQAMTMPEGICPSELVGRRDLRDWQTVTIDGEDAKDLDDAVTISREDFGYRLGVHIADVSHYVTEGSPLDKEALSRGTSVYLVDRVLPMLPHRLSNGICSLNQGEDRLALSCIMDIDGQGRVLGHEIAETVIRVDRRMTYTAVRAIVEDRDEQTMCEYADFVEMFDLMKELADILRKKRKARGSIDFDFPETKVILDAKGRPTEIRAYERNVATRIIEDFMLVANETVAEDSFWQELPFLYRVHDNPDPQRMRKLGVFINNFGYSIRMSNGGVHPKELQKLLTRIEGSEEEALISRLTLRSMKQANYMPTCGGHFGLAAQYYTHFTSPIRRYPDLQIHRILKENLHGGLTETRASHYHGILAQVANQCSRTERRADEAERETIRMKKCEYMSGRIGEEFTGVISGVTGWGFYVELPNTVEGLVHVNELDDDYYVFSEERMELRGERSGRTFRLGQKLRVVVSGADRLMRTVDFRPVAVRWQEE